MAVKFYLRDPKLRQSTIYGIVHHDAKALKFQTGLSCSPRQWSPAKQRLKTTAANSDAELIHIHRFTLDIEAVLKDSPETRLSDASRRLAQLIECRDKFLIGAFTALRFSDYNRLTYIKPGSEYIEVLTTKTEQRLVIRLTDG